MADPSVSQPPPAPNAKLSPVVVATIGTLSGPAGATELPIVQGSQLWVRWINQKGGLNGHPVEQILFDDAGDPARQRAVAEEAVERHHAVAFLANVTAIAGNASVEYINSKRVPVIGSDGCCNWPYQYPMFFPQMPHGDAGSRATGAGMARQMQAGSMSKFGIMFCYETSACAAYIKGVVAEAVNEGAKEAFRAQVSLAQPDYTAECLAARNAGVETLFILLDTNSVGRVAASCARQGYHPILSIPFASAGERFKDDPNFDRMILPDLVFPWFQRNTPATLEFREAFARFGSGIPAGAQIAAGWTAGKLLERAGTALPEPVSSQDVLRGLWSIKNDDLGGLTQPLTFTENSPSRPVSCWFDVRVKDRTWISPDGFQRHCL